MLVLIASMKIPGIFQAGFEDTPQRRVSARHAAYNICRLAGFLFFQFCLIKSAKNIAQKKSPGKHGTDLELLLLLGQAKSKTNKKTFSSTFFIAKLAGEKNQ